MCLIPEVAFTMEGESGLVKYVDKVLSERGHCVLCLAEGAGQVRVCAREGLAPYALRGYPTMWTMCSER